MVPKAQKSILSEADIMMYLALGLKHARLMVLLICLSLVAGLFYYTYARPVYYSRALVRYDSLRTPVDTQTAFRDSSEPAIIRELQSPHLVERTARKLGAVGSGRQIDKLYLKKLKVAFNSEHNLEIEVWPYSYAWAKVWPETLVQEYLLYREERRIAKIKAIFDAFTEEKAQMLKKMDEVLDSRFDFRETNQLTRIIIELNHYKGIPREIQTVKAQLSIMDQARGALQNPNRDTVAKLALLANLEKDIEATQVGARQEVSQVSVGQIVPGENSNPGIVIVPSMIASPLKKAWEGLDMERQGLQNQAHETGKLYLARHPKMLAIQKKLDDVNRALEGELAAEMNRFNLQYVILQEKQNELEQKLPAYDEITRRYQKYVQASEHFNAGQLAWGKMYDQMSQRLNVLDFGANRERADIQFLELLELKDEPEAPNRLRLLIYSLLFGLALAVAIPYFIEYVDSRVSDADKVEEILHIRSLGVVPKIIDAPLETLLLPGAELKGVQHVTENFRLIRTNLILSATSPALPQVILVTSAMPQEGKTIVAAHLAMSFVQKGEKTLLVDGDLRRGRVHRLFGCQNRPGLSEVLTGHTPLEEALRVIGANGSSGGGHEPGRGNGGAQNNGNGKLTVLTCGKHIHYGFELLDSPDFPRMMDNLRQKYQRIILDTPPVLGLSETAVIQRFADGVLLVIWSENTAMRNVKTALQTLQTHGAKFTGFVLNRLDFTTLTNRYKYFYYSPYYYHRYKAIDLPASATGA